MLLTKACRRAACQGSLQAQLIPSCSKVLPTAACKSTLTCPAEYAPSVNKELILDMQATCLKQCMLQQGCTIASWRVDSEEVS